MRLDEFSTFPSVSGLDSEEMTRFLCFGFSIAPALINLAVGRVTVTISAAVPVLGITGRAGGVTLSGAAPGLTISGG